MSAPLELIHLDIHNVNHCTFTGHRYWVTFIDDYTHYQFIFPIKNKLEVLQTFKNFKAYAETQSGHYIKALYNVNITGREIFKLIILGRLIISSKLSYMISTLDSSAYNMGHTKLIDRLSNPSKEQALAEPNILCFICI